MTISSIGNTSVAPQYHQTQNISKGGEAGEVGPDMDGDADDGGSSASPQLRRQLLTPAAS